MNQFLKTGFLLGVGATLAGKEKIEETISKLVEKGSVSQKEADSLFNEFLKKGEAKSGEWNKELKDVVREQLKELGFVSREEFDSLNTQIILMKEELNQIRMKDFVENTREANDLISPNFSNDIE